jgi:putative endopeptidase
MKKIVLYSLIAFAAVSTGCKEKSGDQTIKGLDITNLDTKAIPGTDFFRFATGGWSDANPIPDEFSRYGSFDKLRDENQKQILNLIDELSKAENQKGSVAQKIGDLYKIGMDSVKLNTEGAGPISGELKNIKAITGKAELLKMVAKLNRYISTPFFGLYIGPDDKNSEMNILHIVQGGLGLQERDYYLANDDNSKKLREGYINLIKTQFVNAGYSPEDAAKASSAVMKIETEIAKAHFEKEKTRIPELNYHKFETSQLNDSVAAFDWNLFFNEMGAINLKSVNVAQVEPVASAIKLMETAPIEDLKYYVSWCLINDAAGYLSDNFVNANFDFFGKQMSGAKVLRPRWKRSVSTVENSLGEAVGQLYVEKYFPPKAKKRMLKLVDNLMLSLSERIQGLTWMSDVTKGKAQEKLKSITVKIGYPDKWRSYNALEIKNDSYWANIVRAKNFEYEYQLSKLGQKVDKAEWLMTPQTVNAYYNPTTNEICFPAGILQPPFFYMEGDDAINYGGIGVVIGHEMSHGFDDQGRKYDKQGNMTDWWTAEDAKNFEERTKILVAHFDSIKVLGDLHANGTFTLGENIADNGGLQISYNAFLKTKDGDSKKKIDNYTPQQRFFLSYANLWAGNIRDEEITRLTNLDPHSLGKWRVNGSLPHIDTWYEAFGITEKDPLFLAKDKRASIW